MGIAIVGQNLQPRGQCLSILHLQRFVVRKRIVRRQIEERRKIRIRFVVSRVPEEITTGLTYVSHGYCLAPTERFLQSYVPLVRPWQFRIGGKSVRSRKWRLERKCGQVRCG